MKKLIAFALICISLQSFGQGGWLRPNNSHGTLAKGVGGDSAVYIPTGSGAPNGAIELYTAPIRKSNVYFDSTNNVFYVYNPKDSTWLSLGSPSTDDWHDTGNSGTIAGTNFIGTTDNSPLMFKVGNVQAGVIDLSNGTGPGLGNTSLGYYSLINNTTGYNNVAIGSTTLDVNTTGLRNVAVGVAALGGNTTGYENTAVGTNAMGAGQFSIGNSALGRFALDRTSTGMYNIGIGYNSGDDNTTGSRNIFIGSFSQAENTAGNGNRNIVIGDSSFLATTGNNQLVIGNYIYGTGFDGLGTTISNGKVGFGIKAPDSSVTINLGLHSKRGVRFSGISTGVGTHALRIDALGNITRADTTIGGGGSGISGLTTNELVYGNSATTIASLPVATYPSLAELALIKGLTSTSTKLNYLTSATGTTGTASTNLVFSASPTFTGTINGAAATLSGNLTVNSLTSGRVPHASTAGLLVDNGGFTYNGTNLMVGTGTPPTSGAFVHTYQNAADGIANFKLENANAAVTGGGGPFGQFFQMGTTAYGITPWQNATVFEGQADGGLYLGAYAGNLKLAAAAGGRTVRMTIFGSTGLVQMSAYGAGTATFDGSGNITSVSDRRAKHNITNFHYGLAAIKKLNPANFIYNQDSTNTVMSGFIAQDVQKAIPIIVHQPKTKDGMMSIETNGILAASVNAIKELSDRLDKVEAENKKLKKEIKKLKRK